MADPRNGEPKSTVLMKVLFSSTQDSGSGHHAHLCKWVSKNICTLRKKSNSHYAPQPYTNQSVLKSLLNCASEISLSRNATGRKFQRHGPATEKLLSPRRVRVLFAAHVKTSADRSDRRLLSVKSWQSSARYCGSWPCNALCSRTASLKSMCCRTGNQCSSRRTVTYSLTVHGDL